MKASFINSYGGPDVLEIGEIPDPVPSKGTVLVSVKAILFGRESVIVIPSLATFAPYSH